MTNLLDQKTPNWNRVTLPPARTPAADSMPGVWGENWDDLAAAWARGSQ